MILTDTHTHLNSDGLGFSVPELIRRAKSEQVSRYFIPNIDIHTMGDVLGLGAAYPGSCFPMLGLHPVHVGLDFRDQIAAICVAALAEENAGKVFAIGETGLDLFHDVSFYSEQAEAFVLQAKLAAQLKLPLVLHCRNAFSELMTLMRSHSEIPMRGIFHCFTGSLEEAREILHMGFLLGIGGVLTYKNSQLSSVLANIPLSSMVLETDAPYLSPVPRRGKPNEPANIIYIARRLAEIKGVTVEEVALETTRNSVSVFGG